MVRSIYEMPITTDARGRRQAKYFGVDFPPPDFSLWDYGDEPHCLVAFTDIPPATDTALQAHADVFKLPDNLDTTVGSVSTRNQLRTRLEQDEFPGTWIQTTNTYRDIVRVIGACCGFAQRYQGLVGGGWFTGTVHVASNFSTLTAQQQQGIRDTATFYSFDQTIIQGSNTIRDILKNLADQYIVQYLAGNLLCALTLEGPL